MSNVALGRVMVLGSRGMVGSAVIRRLEQEPGVSQIIPVCRKQVDLINQTDTFAHIASQKPDWIIVAAAKVGGILANDTYPADFISENLAIQLNTIEGARRAGVKQLFFLGSSCIYPKLAAQPIREEALLSGGLEATNEPYAVAKIAGVKLCESYNRQHGTDYRSLMPANLYGPGDNYHPLNSHVIPGLIRRFHEAKVNCHKSVEIWGTGQVRREFLFVDDLADAVIHLMSLPKDVARKIFTKGRSHLNVGTGHDLTIAELAGLIKETVGFSGNLLFDRTKPDGTPRKVLDISRLRSSGYFASTPLSKGLTIAYADYKKLLR